MNEETYYVVTFDSTHYAIKGEKDLKEKGIEIKTIPTPREISVSCGLSIRFDKKDLEQVKKTLGENLLIVNGIYKIRKDKTGRFAEKMK